MCPRHPKSVLAVFVGLSALSAAPFWVTHLLPMQDYPQLLVFARAFGDCRDPASPFFGTYTTGFPLSPLVLPILVLRALAWLTSFETAGRVMWTLYALGLPAASLGLLRALGRSPWCVLLVYPLVFSYWSVGGFFAFATSMPILILGLTAGVRWLMTAAEDPTSRAARRWGIGLSICASALFLWHALSFAQLVLDFAVLTLLVRADTVRARLRLLAPLLPATALFGVWMVSNVLLRSPRRAPTAWPPFLENVVHIFDYMGPVLPGATTAALSLFVVLAGAALLPAQDSTRVARSTFRVANPFVWLALLALVSYLTLPADCLGVAGIQNRQPYLAALLFVFGWSLPSSRLLRGLLLAMLTGANALNLALMARRFRAFDKETSGASRLIDKLGAGETLFAPMGRGSTPSFPGRPIVALDLYASIRHGGLPSTSFAGYDINFIRYVENRAPMPALGSGWLMQPALTRFDYVLLRESDNLPAQRSPRLRVVGNDGGFVLFAVCGGRAAPSC